MHVLWSCRALLNLRYSVNYFCAQNRPAHSSFRSYCKHEGYVLLTLARPALSAIQRFTFEDLWSSASLLILVAIVADRCSRWSVNEEWSGPASHPAATLACTQQPLLRWSFCTRSVSVKITSPCWGTTMSDTRQPHPPSILPCPLHLQTNGPFTKAQGHTYAHLYLGWSSWKSQKHT